MDLAPLADLVEDLKSQEREYYKDLLAGAGVEPSEKMWILWQKPWMCLPN